MRLGLENESWRCACSTPACD